MIFWERIARGHIRLTEFEDRFVWRMRAQNETWDAIESRINAIRLIAALLVLPMADSPWTPERDAQLRSLWDAGYSGRSQSLLLIHNSRGLRMQKNSRIVQLIFLPLNQKTQGYSGSYQGENMD